MKQIISLSALLMATSALLASPVAAQTVPTRSGPVVVEKVTGGLAYPWGMAFMPDGSALVTERPGRVRILGKDGSLSQPLPGVPAVAARGQGGLHDVALDPQFGSNRQVYVCYAEAREGGAITTVSRLTLAANGSGFEQSEVIFRQNPVGNTTRHFGCRLVFDRTGSMFITLGDRGNRMDDAQSRTNTIGKVVRILPDGKIPADNPGHKREGWLASVWSIGHRNVQGAAINPASGKLWTVEHGARGGDEINIPEAGKNYGWPVITYGRDYSGVKIGEGTAKTGMEQPIYHWDPSIAPSGMAFYTGDRFPAWKGSVFVGALAGSALVRLSLNGDKVTGEERLLENLGKRIRDVRQGPDGLIYLLIDSNDGEVLRLKPQ
jgi:aldose sugar dehydrogenase